MRRAEEQRRCQHADPHASACARELLLQISAKDKLFADSGGDAQCDPQRSLGNARGCEFADLLSARSRDGRAVAGRASTASTMLEKKSRRIRPQPRSMRNSFESALDDVEGEAGERGFFVAGLHVEAGAGTWCDDLVEGELCGLPVSCMAMRQALTALTAPMPLRSMQGIWTRPPMGSQVMPRLCSMAISAACSICRWCR
jgi:hypothetical protein